MKQGFLWKGKTLYTRRFVSKRKKMSSILQRVDPSSAKVRDSKAWTRERRTKHPAILITRRRERKKIKRKDQGYECIDVLRNPEKKSEEWAREGISR